MLSLAGSVILYNPDDNVLKNIQSYIKQLSTLYIYDNTEAPNKKIVEDLKALEKAVYFNDQTNAGIAQRLNEAITKASEEGYKWLLTMDQDSLFLEGQVEKYVDCIEEYPDKGRVAMFGVEYERKNNLPDYCSAEQINYLITSGSILNLNLTEAIGPFDENLFIDEVDLEFCYRARSKGYLVVKLGNIFLQHSLGKIVSGISLKTFQHTPRTLHSPLRVYYMVRNYLYVNKKYPQLYPLDNPGRKKALLNRIKNNLIYGREKFMLLRLIIKAYFDFRNKHMGKYQS